LLLLALVAVVYCATVEQQFSDFLVKFNKRYTTQEEYTSRLAIFQKNLAIAEQMNADQETATFGVTKFMDMTPEEFRATMLMPRGSILPKITRPYMTIPHDNIALPTAFDWSSKGAVTPVKDQGQCGSCWAFSATETIESSWFLAGHPLVSLAPQQIVDCDKGRGDEGCNGGDTVTAYAYVMAAGGMEEEKDYTYKAKDGKCEFQASKVAAKIKSWSYITKNKNETEVLYKMYAQGPVSICVDAESWQFYNSGVISKNCATNLDHCVMITGFSDQTVKGTKYPVWAIRNSWGADWGEKGYILVERNKNLCGVAEEVTITVS